MEPKNGDIYLRDNDQIIIFFDPKKCWPGSGADACLTAVFSMSGKWGGRSSEFIGAYTREINEESERITYIGNLSTVFREVLNYEPETR